MVTAALGHLEEAPLVTVQLSGTTEDRLIPTIRGDDSPASRKRRSQTLERLDLECTAIQAAGYNPAVTVLIRLALEVERRGHTLLLEGAAGGATLFYVAGLTPFDPCDHGLLAERFLATKGAGDGDLFHSSDDVPIDLVRAQVSMSLPDLLTLLRQRGYSFSVETDTIPGYPTRTIVASVQGLRGLGRTISLVVETTDLAVLSNSLGRITPPSLETDAQTWEMLGWGDTNGITPLASPNVQAALRTRKPRSLLALADVLVATRGDAGNASEQPVVYQEDLMGVVRERLGTDLRSTWNLIRVLSRPQSPRRAEARKWFFGESRRTAKQIDGLGQFWADLAECCPVAVCKAHYLTIAYHCFRAAFLKSHYPGDFKGVLAAM